MLTASFCVQTSKVTVNQHQQVPAEMAQIQYYINGYWITRTSPVISVPKFPYFDTTYNKNIMDLLRVQASKYQLLEPDSQPLPKIHIKITKMFLRIVRSSILSFKLWILDGWVISLGQHSSFMCLQIWSALTPRFVARRAWRRCSGYDKRRE